MVEQLTCLHEGISIGNLVAVATVGENFKRLRAAAGYDSPAAFIRAAKDQGIELSASQVSDLENDRYGSHNTEKLQRFARALSCRVIDLLKDVDDADAPRQQEVDADRIDVSGHTREDIPVIAEGEASPQGHLFWSNEGQLIAEVEDRISRPFDVLDPRAYGVRVRGDSMLPIYRAKMVLVVSPRTPVVDGDEVYVELLSGERLIKIARRQQAGWVLESANPAYAARFVTTAEIGAMHPIVWSQRKPSGQRVVSERRTAAAPISERALAIAREIDRLPPERIDTIETYVTELAPEDEAAVSKPRRGSS